jgi:hypothetical protein
LSPVVSWIDELGRASARLEGSRPAVKRSGVGPVPSLGHDAYCINKPVAVLVQSFVVVSLGSEGSLQVLAEDCTKATALTKDALARISGL